MATIDRLLDDDGPLTDVTVPLDRYEYQKRWIYGLPQFVKWLQEDVPRLRTGRLKSDLSPKEQVDHLLYRWITGKEMKYDKMFKDLIPAQDEVWEMKTLDIRIFGWMFMPCKFVAVFGDHADFYKRPNPTKNYSQAVRRVVRERDHLDLDEPKLETGEFDALVCV
jgi:hypothetical protein